MSQKLATIERIQEVFPHPNADKVELAKCCNYQCVVPISKYKKGDDIVFIHPDATLPKELEWSQPFLKFCKNRVKAVRFRGMWSFGIIAGFPEEFEELNASGLQQELKGWFEGQDIAGLLYVEKYEVKYPAHQQNKLNPRRPHLPHSLPKTDEERYQSIDYLDKILGETVDVTLKIDGQSWTAYYKDGDFGVTSRGTDYKLDIDERNNFTRHLDKYPIEENLTKYCIDNKVNIAIRGESYGTSVQNFKHNPHSKLTPGLALFSCFNLDELRYERRESPLYIFKLAPQLRLPTVPIIEEGVVLTKELIEKYENLDKINGNNFEGVVINGRNFSFKVINFKYDEKK